jgi:chemotaxis signal transduction protein
MAAREGELMRVLIIPVNAEFYAVPMESVRQVMRRTEVTRVPMAPSGLLGVINVRGEILPLLDTGVLTGSGAIPSAPYSVLINTDKESVALAAQAMPITADFDEPVSEGSHPGELGVYSSGGRLVVLINTEELVASHLELTRAK